MVTQILSMVLPVLVMILLGRLCATKGILNDERHAGLKAIIGDILLPVRGPVSSAVLISVPETMRSLSSPVLRSTVMFQEAETLLN